MPLGVALGVDAFSPLVLGAGDSEHPGTLSFIVFCFISRYFRFWSNRASSGCFCTWVLGLWPLPVRGGGEVRGR